MKTSLDLIDRLNRVRDAVLVGQMALHSEIFQHQERSALTAHLIQAIDDIEALSEEFSDALGIRPDAGIAPDGAAAEADEPAAAA